MARAGAGGPAKSGTESVEGSPEPTAAPEEQPDEAGEGGLAYEAARDALAEVVAKLEAGNLTLEESLALWERGESLAAVCRARLDGARARVDAVLQGDGRQEVDHGRN